MSFYVSNYFLMRFLSYGQRVRVQKQLNPSFSLTTNMFQILMPYLPDQQYPGSLVTIIPAWNLVLLSLLMLTGLSCTLPKQPTPCPVPCRQSFPTFHRCLLAKTSISAPVSLFAGHLSLSMSRLPSRTRVKLSFSSEDGAPKWKARVTSVVPSKYCPPESRRWTVVLSILAEFASVGRQCMIAPFGPDALIVSKESPLLCI